MSGPDLDLGDVQIDPAVQNRYERAMSRNTTMPAPPPVDHPIVQMAQKMLAPLASGDNYLDNGQGGGVQTSPEPFFQKPLNSPTFDLGQAVNGIWQNLSGPDMPWNQPLNPDAPANIFNNVPLLGGIQNTLNQQLANAPLGENGAIVKFRAYKNAQQQYGADSPEAQAARQDFGDSAIGVVGGLSGGSGRFKAEVGKSRSFVVDTATGKSEPLTYNGADHAAKAEASAAKLNAQTGTAPDAGIAVAPEAGIRAVLHDLTNVKTTDGNLGRTVRIGIREQGVTVDHLMQSPEIQGQAMQAFARKKMPASDENIASVIQQLFEQERTRPTQGNKEFAAVKEALVGNDPLADPFANTTSVPGVTYPGFEGKIPNSVNVPMSAEQVAAEARLQTPEQIAQNANLSRANLDRQTAPRLVATSHNASTLPAAPNRFNIGKFGLALVDETNSLMRAATAGGDVSTVGLQGAPLLLKDIAKMFLDPAGIKSFLTADGGAFNGRPGPYFQTAFARFGQALVAGEGGGKAGIYGRELPFSAPTQIRDITQGFHDALAKEGISSKAVGISDPAGPMLAREELAAGKIITNVPGIGLLYRQTSYATTTLMNAIRTGEALALKRDYDALKIPFESDRVGNFIKVATGRADLPLGIQEGSNAARAFQWLFFGPRLMTSAFKTIPDTIASVLHVGSDVVHREPLKPVDIARIQTTATFVATGWGLLKIAEASGLAVGTDPEKTDFGRLTLPGGIRIDFWGPFNEEARLIAREVAIAGRGLRGGKAPYGEQDPLYNYFRSKLGPVPGALESVRRGSNVMGQTPNEVIQSTLNDPNPLSNPTSVVPAPFTAQTAALAFDPARGGPGGVKGAGLTALGALGISVMPPRNNIPKDGLGRPETDPNFGKDEIINEYENLFPGKTLAPPDDTIGSGKTKVKLPSTKADEYIAAVGEARRVDLGNLIYSPAYQAMTQAQKEKAYQNTKEKADNRATREYLATGVIKATDPATIAAEAVAGFHAQGGSNKNEAYWVALLDRAGKLTPEVAKAIDESNVVMPGQRAPISVKEMREDAPLVHEYLAHVPYGSDKTPIGTPADWQAVQAAKQQQSVLKDQMIRSGVNPSLAEVQAKQQTLQGLTSVAQRSLFLNGASLANQQRKLLIQKYGTRLSRYVQGDDVPYSQESDAQYQNFPFGQ